jgi:hypothetical protein
MWSRSILNAAIAVFSPGDMNNSAVVGKKLRATVKKEKRKKEVLVHLTSA